MENKLEKNFWDEVDPTPHERGNEYLIVINEKDVADFEEALKMSQYEGKIIVDSHHNKWWHLSDSSIPVGYFRVYKNRKNLPFKEKPVDSLLKISDYL